MHRWYRRWLTKSRGIPDRLWGETLARIDHARKLPRRDRLRLRELAAGFLQKKTFDGAAGLEITEAMRAGIAVRACVPILNLGLNYYTGWNDIVLYPGDFRVKEEYIDDAGIVHRETRDLCGESLSQGPMVLSWNTVASTAGRSAVHDLVIHECAHKLDLLNGAADGFPPLHDDMDPRRWTRDLSAGYDRLCTGLDAGMSSIDPYAVTDAAEFFAVLSETFFAAPEIVYSELPAVYAQLRLFYRQHPCAPHR